MMDPGSRLLFIAPDHGDAVGGREQLSRLHEKALGELLGGKLDVIRLAKARAGMSAALSGRIDGVTREAEGRILAHIAEHDIGRVWLDGSNLGVLARAIKRRLPMVEVLSFFHNIEPRFFWGALKRRPGARALGVLAATFIAERAAARFSDRRVALNARDAAGIERWHGRAATDLLPMAIADGWAPLPEPPKPPPPSLLFVGGAFHANRAGIAWFAREVAPAIGIDTLVVGAGMEEDRAALEAFAHIRVVGRVDALAPYYRDALAVVAPIFDGSGMKTKVAEALMHGKRVIGTKEAFTGYEGLDADVRCDTRVEYIAAIRTLAANPPPRFDPALRALYEAHFSPQALGRQLKKILGA